MRTLTTGFAAAAALALLVSAGQACDFHASHVTASVDKAAEGVAMSTYDGAAVPTILEETTETAAATECPDGAADCPPADE
jgi:hypothetical protein